jgi:hypothetical protein
MRALYVRKEEWSTVALGHAVAFVRAAVKR